MLEYLESFPAFLVWLGTGGGAIAAFSWLVELFPAWHALKPEAKRLYSIVGSIVIAVAAFVGLQYIPAEVIEAIDPYFKLLAGLLVTYFGGQAFHVVTKRK